jgi:hypothetical protein
MNQNYHITYDPASRTVRIVMSGFWQLKTLVDFTGEIARLYAKVAATKPKPGGGHILVDMRGFMVQKGAIANELAKLVPHFGKLAGHIAVIGSSSALQNHQLSRMLDDPRCRIVASEAEANAWLFGCNDDMA